MDKKKGVKKTSWKKGQSGNPRGGVRKEHSLTKILNKIALEKRKGSTKTNIEKLAQMLWDIAFEKKDMIMLKYLCDRIAGRPDIIQQIQQTTNIKNPVYDMFIEMRNKYNEEKDE